MDRRHRTQMTDAEILFVETLIHATDRWIIESALIHASRNGRRFTREEVLEALHTGLFVEVNSLGRVLFRSAKGVCVVVSLQGRYAVTVWFNRPQDTHKTLKRSEYTWKVNVIEYVKSEYRGAK